MRNRPLPRKFSSGELAPWLDGITNELTQQGCLTIENYIIEKQGQAMRRPGSFIVNEVKDSSKATGLVPVTIDDDNTYVLEIGDAYIRFYKNHARITYPATTTIYEVTSPWSTGDISNLRWVYSPVEKAVYFSNRKYSTQRLSWTSDNSWTIFQAPLVAGGIYALYDGGDLLYSEDLINWTRKHIQNTTLYSIGFNKLAFGRNNLVASNATQNISMTEDGDNWINTFSAVGTSTSDIDGSEDGTIAAVGLVGSGIILASFDDGTSWVSIFLSGFMSHLSGTALAGIAYDEVRKSWRGSGQGADGYSYDLKSWVSITSPGVSPVKIAGYDDLWVAGGTAAGAVGSGLLAVANSLTANWTITLNISGDYFTNLCRGTPAGNTLWVAITNTNSWVYVSSTANSWTRVATLVGFVHDVEWVHSKFIAMTSGTLWTSYDGTTWLSSSPTNILPSRSPVDMSFEDNPSFQWFDSSTNYPHCLAYHEGRLVVGPTDREPSTLWGSKTDVFQNFFLGDLADQAFSYTLASEQNVDIQWIMGNVGGLLVGTRTAEGILIGSPQEGITPLTAQFHWISTFGSSNIQPVRIHDTIAFVQRGGEVIRGYEPGPNGDQSLELTVYADHISKGGITKLAHQDDPQSILYAIRADGQLLALTFNNARRARYGLSPQVLALTAEEDTRAWARIKTARTAGSVGIIESLAIIPTTGAEDEIWQVVNRNIAGATKRYIEYYAPLSVPSLVGAHYVDCGVEATSGVTFATVGSLTHLAGEVVDALVDGTRWVAGLTVAASGTISLLPYSGTDVHVGLPYASRLQTMRGDYGSQYGDGAGLNKRTSRLLAWVHDSTALAKFGPTSLLATETIVYSQSTALATELCDINFPGQYDRDNYIWCVVTDPRPFTLVAILPDSETSDR